MEPVTQTPTEPARYMFRGTFYDQRSGFTIHIKQPIEVEVLRPEAAVRQNFMAIGDPVEVPPPRVKQFIRSLDGIYIGGAGQWTGEWVGPLGTIERD